MMNNYIYSQSCNKQHLLEKPKKFKRQFRQELEHGIMRQ